MDVGLAGLHAIHPILSEKGISTTLFTTAHFAEHFPEKIREMAEKHEIASHTYYHGTFHESDIAASKLKLEKVTGKNITGIRMPRMMPVSSQSIIHAGYTYDASIHPTWLPGRYNNLKLPRTSYFENGLLRIPASVSPRFRLPLFWLSFKNFPFGFYKRLALRTLKNDGMLSLYFHPWEFVEIGSFGLPHYTRKICAESLVERLYKLLKFLSSEADFLTMDEYATIFTKKNSGTLRTLNFASSVQQQLG